MQLIILGMYGSTTLRGVLHEMGVYHGFENIGNSEEKPKILREREDISILNHEMIRTVEADWDTVSDFVVEKIAQENFEDRIRDILSDLDAHKPWMISDPSLCLLFPVWRKFLEAPICIHVVGNPVIPIRFLNSAKNLPTTLSIALWEKYNLAAFKASAGLPRLSLPYQLLMTDPVRTVTKLYESLCESGVQGLHLPTREEILAITTSNKSAEDFFNNKKNNIHLNDYINPKQKQLHTMLQNASLLSCEPNELPLLSAGAREILRQHDINQRTLNMLETEYYNAGEDLKETEILWRRAEEDIVKLAKWVDMLNEDISATFNSLTWKAGVGLTEMLRRILFVKKPTAREHIEHIFKEFHHWKDNKKHLLQTQKSKSTPHYFVKKRRAITSFYAFTEGGQIPRWPLEIFLEVSNVCDLKCAMCHTFSAFNPKRLFSIKKEERGFFSEYGALESLLQHSLRVHCFGYGEPTLHPQFQEIISYISNYEVLIDFFTNGMHLTKSLCEFLVNKRVHRIVLSFSGATKEDYENIYIGGNYEKVLAGISQLAKTKVKHKSPFPKIEVNSMAFQHQLDKIVEFVDLMADHGVNIITVKPVTGFANIPQLHPHIAIMRPWVEGKLLEKATIRAEERKISFNATPFITAMKVETAEEVEQRRKNRIVTRKRKYTSSFIPIDQLRVNAEKVVAEKPPDLFRESQLQTANVDYPKTKEAMRDFLDIRAPEPTVDIPCCEPFKTFYVQKSGSVKPCCFGLKNTEVLLGNVNQNAAEEIWQGAGFQAVQQAILNGEYPMKICKECIAYKLYPKDHYVEHLIRGYSKWFEESFDQVFDPELLDKALKLDKPKKIISKRF